MRTYRLTVVHGQSTARLDEAILRLAAFLDEFNRDNMGPHERQLAEGRRLHNIFRHRKETR